MKVALIGYGYWGKIIRSYIEQDDNFELVKICTLEKEQKQDHFYVNDLDEITENPNIEAAFICTPVSTHFSICKKLPGFHCKIYWFKTFYQISAFHIFYEVSYTTYPACNYWKPC